MSINRSGLTTLIVLQLVVLMGSVVHAQPGQNFIVANAPICDLDQISSWERTRDSALGVAGRDPIARRGNIRDYLDYYAAIKDAPFDFFGKNWYPVDGLKHTLCGKLHKYNFYDGSGAEADWNNYIIPGPGFDYLMDEVRPLMSIALIRNPLTGQLITADSWHDCCPARDASGMCPPDKRNNCLEAEITPDENFYGNRWFPKPVLKVSIEGGRLVVTNLVKDESPLEGQTLCAYGPWIYEEVHGNRPEIHPSELLWWREARADGGAGPKDWLLMLVQDDSNRFDRAGDFSGSNRPPEWRPWSQFPRTGEFKIGFEVNLSEPPATYTILELEKRHVVTGTLNTPAAREARRDGDDGKQHALEYQGRIVLKVNELQADGDNLGVRFEGICRDDANSRLHGYITITSMVGSGDGRSDLRPNPGGAPLLTNTQPAKEGYHVLRVIKDFNFPSIEPAAPSATPRVVTFAPLRLSLRKANVDGRSQLVSDLEVHMVAGQGESAADITIAKTEFVIGDRRLNLAFDPRFRDARPGESIGLIKGVPVFAAGALDITTRSDTRRYTPAATALAPMIAKETPLSTAADQAASGALMKAVKASPPPGSPTARLLKAQQWQISVAPFYSGVRADSVAPAEESLFSEDLNEIVRTSDPASLRRVFESDRPFKVQWEFKAIDLSTGAEVPVKVVRASSPAGVGEVHVDFPPGTILDKRIIHVTFPNKPTQTIYELTATATMSDSNGATGNVQHRVWSHFLPATPPVTPGALRLEESTLLAFGILAGIQVGNLQTALRLDDAPSEHARQDVRTRRARMLRVLLRHSSEDGRISVEELSRLISMARLFDSQ